MTACCVHVVIALQVQIAINPRTVCAIAAICESDTRKSPVSVHIVCSVVEIRRCHPVTGVCIVDSVGSDVEWIRIGQIVSVIVGPFGCSDLLVVLVLVLIAFLL